MSPNWYQVSKFLKGTLPSLNLDMSTDANRGFTKKTKQKKKKNKKKKHNNNQKKKTKKKKIKKKTTTTTEWGKV